MLRIGILGAGGIVPWHLRAAQKHPAVEIVHIADMRLDVAHQMAAEYGIERVSQDAAAVVSDTQVEAVIIALPTHLHLEWITRAARAGKHILTEKPLCRTVGQGRQAIAACTQADVHLAVGYMRRFSPARLRVRELVQSGALGRPVTWTISRLSPRSDFYRGPGNWMWDLEKGGGLTMDGHIHDFDFATWVLGSPVEMYAQSSCISEAVTAPTQVAAIVRFTEGDNLVFGAAWPEGDYGEAGVLPHLVGPRGSIVLEDDITFTWHHEPGKKQRFHEEADLFYRQLDSFVSLVREGKADLCLAMGEDALASLWVAENIIAAGPTGRLCAWGVA